MPLRPKIPDLPNSKKLELAERSRINDLSVNYIDKQRKLHAERINALKQETNSHLYHSSSNKDSSEKSDVPHNTYYNHLKPKSYTNETKSEISDISDETLLRRLSFNKRKSTLLKDIYELKHVSTNNLGSLIKNKKNKCNNNQHIFDVYLENEESKGKRERLPSLVNLYNKANQLKLIERFHPSTVQSFNELIKTSSLHRPNPTYEFNST